MYILIYLSVENHRYTICCLVVLRLSYQYTHNFKINRIQTKLLYRTIYYYLSSKLIKLLITIKSVDYIKRIIL